MQEKRNVYIYDILARFALTTTLARKEVHPTMLRLYCRCGYPLWVAARWTGTTIALVLRDGTQAAEHTLPPLQQCPQCRMLLDPHSLEGYPLPPTTPTQPRLRHAPQPPPSSPPAAPVSWPAADPQAASNEPEDRSLVKRLLEATTGTVPKPQGRRRVLVVDDDQDIREVLQQWLASEGFQVASARDGHEALTLLQQEPGGWVVLLDLLMPHMDGWAFLHHLPTQAGRLEDQKIVLMSASRVLAQAGPPWRSAQVVAAVPKPVDLDHLLAVLMQLTSE